MANRQDGDNEDALPEMTDTGNRAEIVRNEADDDADEFEDTEDLDEEGDDESDEGTF